jgi:hypothetical protein
VSLSLQNLRSDSQAQSRLAMLRPELNGQGTSWNRACPLGCLLPRLPRPIFGGKASFEPKPAFRMHAATSLTSARPASGDTSVNAKQEGSP